MKPSTAIGIFMWFGVIYVAYATQNTIATFSFLALIAGVQTYVELKQESPEATTAVKQP